MPRVITRTIIKNKTMLWEDVGELELDLMRYGSHELFMLQTELLDKESGLTVDDMACLLAISRINFNRHQERKHDNKVNLVLPRPINS